MSTPADPVRPSPRFVARARHARKLVIPLVLAVGLIAGASALVTTGVGCSDDGGPRPDGNPGDGDVDTPII